MIQTTMSQRSKKVHWIVTKSWQLKHWKYSCCFNYYSHEWPKWSNRGCSQRTSFTVVAPTSAIQRNVTGKVRGRSPRKPFKYDVANQQSQSGEKSKSFILFVSSLSILNIKLIVVVLLLFSTFRDYLFSKFVTFSVWSKKRGISCMRYVCLLMILDAKTWLYNKDLWPQRAIQQQV